MHVKTEKRETFIGFTCTTQNQEKVSVKAT